VRLARGLSQVQIERYMGKSDGSGYLSNVERGGRDKRPSNDLIQAIITMTGASEAYLVDGTEPMFTEVSPPAVPPMDRPAHVEKTYVANATNDIEPWPSLRQFLLLGESVGLDPPLLEALKRENHTADPGDAHWVKRYGELRELRNQLVHLAQPRLPSEEEALEQEWRAHVVRVAAQRPGYFTREEVESVIACVPGVPEPAVLNELTLERNRRLGLDSRLLLTTRLLNALGDDLPDPTTPAGAEWAREYAGPRRPFPDGVERQMRLRNWAADRLRIVAKEYDRTEKELAEIVERIEYAKLVTGATDTDAEEADKSTKG